MNLIEQLGGYEAAKGLFNLYEYSISFKYYKVFKGDFESAGYIDVFIPDLQKALLEYRRQHNIFEVGDKVVFTDILHSCVVTFESTETDPMQIVWLTYPDGTAGYVFHLNKIKHATDEEIKAGKRLEVS